MTLPEKHIMRWTVPAWLLLLLSFVVIAALLGPLQVAIAAAPLRRTLFEMAGLLAAFVICRHFWPNGRVANFAHIALITWGFVVATLLLSYLAAGFRMPLTDETLLKADALPGIDWEGFYDWANRHPALHDLWMAAYASFLLQKPLLDIVLNARGQRTRSWELLWLSVLTCLVCIVLSGLWPAAGPLVYLHIGPVPDYYPDFTMMHDGAVRIIGQTAVHGIITFPSFHAAMAVIYAYVARAVPRLALPMLVLNIFMAASTIVIGGHYFADVWGGIIVAVIVIVAVRCIETRCKLAC